MPITCNRCEIWTGSAAASIKDAVGDCSGDHHAVYGAVRLAFVRDAERRGISLTTSTRTVVITDDMIRSIDINCSSPFSMAVLLQIDVNEATQAVVTLGRVVSEGADQGEDALDSQILRINDHAETLVLLTALHDHLRDVPLSAPARDLLTKQRSQLAAQSSTAPGSSIMKKRRSIDPQAFYGGKNVGVAGSHASSEALDDQSWKTFYQRLQFNVSHSLLCQLEGTAPLSSTFPRQQEAFEFADQVAAFRQRLSEQRGINASSNEELNHPRVFCYEGANEGKRQFWVTTLEAFWKEYKLIPKGSRHVYEIIREGTACRLYFDLEFKKQLNQDVDGDALVTRLISLVQLQIYREFRLVISRQLHVVELESSTPDKFSRHLTIHLPNGELFLDNIHAGSFVKRLIHDLVLPPNSDESSPFLVRDSVEDTKKQLFIDVGVYTRNRMFRILGSSKYRKTAVLRRLGASTDDDSLDQDLFLRSIVCPGTRSSSQNQSVRLLRCDDTVSLKRYGAAQAHSNASYQPMRSVESRSSLYPALDAFIRSLSTTGGIQGEIRTVNLLYPTSIEADASTDQQPLVTEPLRVVYHMMKNRWCENIGRPHKSNNVMFVVDLSTRTFVQRCHDPHCHAMDYRSPARPLPQHLELIAKHTE